MFYPFEECLELFERKSLKKHLNAQVLKIVGL